MDQILPANNEKPIEIAKPELEEPKSSRYVWLKSLGSLAFFLVIGYFFFRRTTGDSYSAWALVIVLTGVVVFHELGHFVAMKIYKYRDLGMFFIPLLGAYVSGKNKRCHKNNQRSFYWQDLFQEFFLALFCIFYPFSLMWIFLKM